MPTPIIEKPPSAGLWPGQSDEEEIGFTYAAIDRALTSLEANNWTASNAQEELILGKVQASMHKRMSRQTCLVFPEIITDGRARHAPPQGDSGSRGSPRR